MSFFEAQFDQRISYGARGGPVWSTALARSIAGRRYGVQNWAAPLHRYNVAHGIKSNADFETVRAFFYVVAGQFDGFRFKDWADFNATQANSRCTLVSGTNYQLQRVYAVGGREFVRTISKPVASPAAVVRRLRSGVWSDATATVSTTTGIADISGHMGGDTYAWVGQFDVPVAFTDDALEAVIENHGADDYLVTWPTIMLEEVRL